MTEQIILAPEEIVGCLERALSVDHPRRDLRLTDTIRENLRLDSLALMELLTRVEEQLDLELIDRPEVYTSVTTVGDLVALIQDVLAARP